MKMKFVLSDDIPIEHSSRRMSYADQIVVQNQLEEVLKDGIIKPSYSEYAAPIVLVSKKDVVIVVVIVNLILRSCVIIFQCYCYR